MEDAGFKTSVSIIVPIWRPVFRISLIQLCGRPTDGPILFSKTVIDSYFPDEAGHIPSTSPNLIRSTAFKKKVTVGEVSLDFGTKSSQPMFQI
jgi:hypothetical protein